MGRGMGMGMEGADLEGPPAKRPHLGLQWEEVTYEVPGKEKDDPPLRLLDGVSGSVRPGEIVAVMGPSGCGKTTLLNVLGMRWTGGMGGTVSVNGVARPPHFKRFLGYSTQDAPFLRVFTVRETLAFFASLKLGKGESSPEQQQARVSEVMEEMDMTEAADVYIGDPLEGGISGGQARRLGIAAELINCPPILMLDEPTSGLDAATAYNLCRILGKYASEKKVSVVMTIHQPRSAMLQSISRLLILARGKAVYYGPSWSGKAAEEGDTLLGFFEQHLGRPCPRFENPGDWIMDAIVNDDLAEEKATVAKLNSGLLDKPPTLEYLSDIPTETEGLSDSTQALYTQSFFARSRILFSRTLKYKLREPAGVMTQAVNSVFMPVIISLIYLRMGLSQLDIQDRFAAISFMILMQAFLGFDQILVFPTERRVFQRDHESGQYCVLSYFLSRIAAELPFILGFGAIAGTIAYWMMGFQNDAEKFLTFLAIMICVTDVGMSLLNMIGAASKTTEQANMLTTVVLLIFMLFNGFYVNTANVGAYFRWIKHINFLYYSTRAATVNEFKGLVFECTAEEAATMGCIPTGDAFLKRLGFADADILVDCLILIGMSVFFRLCSFQMLKSFYWNKK